MNIIEAMRAGRPFKRKCMTNWWTYNEMSQTFYEIDDRNSLHKITLDTGGIWDSVFHCDDWEVKPEEITVTMSDVYDAVHQASNWSAQQVWLNLKERVGK